MIVGRGRGVGGSGGFLPPPAARSLRHARGQALALTLPLLAVLVAALWWAYDAGQAVTEKRRLAQTADAVALSAATWQSRALNFDAYTNRAIIANEAAIAQSVSLRGWSRYMNDLLLKTAVLTAWIPYVDAATASLARLWEGLDRGLQPGLSAFEGMTTLVDQDIAAAQRAMHLATAEVVPASIRESLHSGDGRVTLSPGGEAALVAWQVEWVRFASFYGGAWRWRQKDVLERSLDGFTTRRNNTWRPLFGVDIIRLEKRGGTDLIGFDTWRALDTLSEHQRRYVLFGRMREQVPLVWAAVQSGIATAARGVHGNALQVNPAASRAGLSSMRRDRIYRGLPSVWDLSTAQRAQFDPPRIPVRIMRRPASAGGAADILGVRSVAALNGDEQVLQPGSKATSEPTSSSDSPTLPADAMFAMAVSTSEFSRPSPRADAAIEKPSLYAPFWYSRMVAPTVPERVLMATLDGDPLWLASLPR